MAHWRKLNNDTWAQVHKCQSTTGPCPTAVSCLWDGRQETARGDRAQPENVYRHRHVFLHSYAMLLVFPASWLHILPADLSVPVPGTWLLANTCDVSTAAGETQGRQREKTTCSAHETLQVGSSLEILTKSSSWCGFLGCMLLPWVVQLTLWAYCTRELWQGTQPCDHTP